MDWVDWICSVVSLSDHTLAHDALSHHFPGDGVLRPQSIQVMYAPLVEIQWTTSP